MKRIVIVTWCGGPNYGTSLQAFALEKKVRDLGFDACTLLSLPRHQSIFRRGLNIVKSLLRRIFRGTHSGRSMQSKARDNNVYAERIKRVTHWRDRAMCIIRPSSASALRNLIKHTDCFISGSDQIWNSYYQFLPMMYLSFVGKKDRISYASSIGTRSVNPNYSRQIKKLLARYRRISVREKSAIPVLQSLLNRQDITQVPDPTFLLSAEEWDALSSGEGYKTPQDYALCYILGNRTDEQMIMNVARAYGVSDIVVVPAAERHDFSISGATIVSDANPLEFVELIKNATVICTDSFHGTALSINLKKQFVEFLRFAESDVKSQNSRIYDLLEHYGLIDRIYDHFTWEKRIDYDKVSNLVKKDRASAVDYLLSTLR